MKTIRNINEELGMDVTFSADTVDEAVAEMLAAVQDCGPEMAEINELVEGQDYEIVEND